MAATAPQRHPAIPLNDLPSDSISAIALFVSPPELPFVRMSPPKLNADKFVNSCPAQPQSGIELLAVASWDATVRIYTVTLGPPAPAPSTAFGKPPADGKEQPAVSISNVTVYHGYQHQAPVLALAWSSDGTTLFSGACDNTIRMCKILEKTDAQLGQHTQPVSSLVCVDHVLPNAIASGSWDKTIKYWNYETGQLLGSTPELPERVYSMDADADHLVAALADRHIVYFGLSSASGNGGDPTKPAALPDTPDEVGGPPQSNSNPFYSPLSFQTKVVRCFPPGTPGYKPGFAIGSVEGRVGVHYTTRKSLRENYAFRCHRKDRQPKPFSGPAKQDLYSINDIAFNKAFGTVATLGGDGSFVFWDMLNHQRLKEIQRFELNGTSMDGIPMTSGSFNGASTLFAYAFSYDWARGSAGRADPPPRGVGFYCVAPVDVQLRPKK